VYRANRILLATLVVLAQGCTTEGASQQTRSFSQVGVIEGFYGPPWSHRDRLDVIRFMGDVGLTTYYYAPKDDPYHRQRWREPYPADRWAELGELVDTARARSVRFVYAISPGGSMAYADTADYGALLQKLVDIESLGVEDFALFLDDVPPTLEHETDRAAYETLADAHADLTNRLHADLQTTGASLALTPTTYTNAWGDREYLRRLGQQAAREVPFFWTGVDVAAPEITALQAREWGALTGRPPLVWDNYPVNDFARWRPFLGPIRHRASDLPSQATGILSNPMNEAHASMIALATLAAYAEDPAGYDPDAALAWAVEYLYGSGASRLLAPFLAVWGDYADDQNLFEPLFIPGEPIDVAAAERALARLEVALVRLDSAAAASQPLGSLRDDLAPFVRRTAARLAELSNDAAYERRGGTLAFRRELERYRTGPTRPTLVDGALDEWADATWYDLRSGGRSSGATPRVAFRHHGEHLMLALQVPLQAVQVHEGARVGTGDHIALVLQSDTLQRRYLTPDDLLLFVAPPTERRQPTVHLYSLPVDGFMAKYLADNGGFTFSEFLLSTLATPPTGWGAGVAQGVRWGARPTLRGYDVEIALPLQGRERLRLSLSVVGTRSGRRVVAALARRIYPANPATFSEIVVPR
jgi:hyaluronoglucosaminidase